MGTLLQKGRDAMVPEGGRLSNRENDAVHSPRREVSRNRTAYWVSIATHTPQFSNRGVNHYAA